MSKQSILDIRNQEITIYRDHCRFEATSVIVDRVNENNKVEHQFMFKMQLSGKYYCFVHGDDSYTIILLGWGLPVFDSIQRLDEGLPLLTVPPVVGDQLFTVGQGIVQTQDDVLFQDFLDDLDPAIILFESNNFAEPRMK